MIHLNPMTWRSHQSNLPSFACCLYKAIFPMITPTIKNKTTSASSRVLRPSSFPAAANTGTGLLLCAAFLIRSPSSSYGSKHTFQRQSKAPEQQSTVQLGGRGGEAVMPRLDHMMRSNLLVLQMEKQAYTEEETGLRPPQKYCREPLFSPIHPTQCCWVPFYTTHLSRGLPGSP